MPPSAASSRTSIGWRSATKRSPSVSVGDFQSDADEDDRAREREETKRLLYVALTRARDRLYLSSVLKDGRVQAGRGSLAEVLPASLLQCFTAVGRSQDLPLREAATAGGSQEDRLLRETATEPAFAEWQASSGRIHR